MEPRKGAARQKEVHRGRGRKKNKLTPPNAALHCGCSLGANREKGWEHNERPFLWEMGAASNAVLSDVLGKKLMLKNVGARVEGGRGMEMKPGLLQGAGEDERQMVLRKKSGDDTEKTLKKSEGKTRREFMDPGPFPSFELKKSVGKKKNRTAWTKRLAGELFSGSLKTRERWGDSNLK